MFRLVAHPLLQCGDDISTKADSAIAPKLIRMRCSFSCVYFCCVCRFVRGRRGAPLYNGNGCGHRLGTRPHVLVPNNREDAATRLIVGLDAWSVLLFVVKIVEASEVFRDVVSQPPTRDHLVCYIKDEDVRCQGLADSAARMRSSRRGVKKGQPGHG